MHDIVAGIRVAHKILMGNSLSHIASCSQPEKAELETLQLLSK